MAHVQALLNWIPTWPANVTESLLTMLALLVPLVSTSTQLIRLALLALARQTTAPPAT